ncbi:NAD(P)-dependent oxidoreductase [Pseudomonas sp. RIT-PI-AD]|uniref:NAD(P)-dependent oxidoreductase n=1 Tax=Pseudomonas sp. RIT-PI-AD TaxID=3035294 RepID=UPI0021D8DB92|nr:NAD(P)-dependent oxidoreductase [Pseudomonas sp. RIT-PI-AD]
MKIGFIGLGTMGLPMASNLIRAGHTLCVWSRSAASSRPAFELGAHVVGDPADAAQADVVISMLADDAAVEDVFIAAGVLDALRPGAIHLNMATVSVALTRRLSELHAARQVGYIAAPVLGRADVAAAGKLNILAAGRPEDLDPVQPLLDVLGQRTWRLGDDPAQASAAKLAVNLMIAAAIEATAEATTLASGHGIAPADFIDLVTSTLFAVPVYQGYGRLMAEGRFEPAGFKLALGLKDVRLALEAGEAARVPLPFASVLKDNLLDGVAHGQGDFDWAALSEVSARRAGRPFRSAGPNPATLAK